MRERARVKVAVGSIVAMLVAVGAVLVSPSSGAAPTNCELVPQLRDVTVNQGLGSYTPLARGKEALVRAYLSLPSCAPSGAAIEVRGGQVTVAGLTDTTTASLPVPANPYPQAVAYTAGPALDSPADLKFVVPGSALDAAGDLPGTATFSIKIDYGARSSKTGSFTAGSRTFTTVSGSATSIAKPVSGRINALRVLVVPMGNASDLSGAQFPDTAVATVQNGMQTVGRIYGVRDGVGDLNSTTAGLRYTLLSSMIDLGPNGLNLMSGGQFCARGSTWGLVKGELAQRLQAWNSADPPNPPADVVVGVVWQGVSAGGASGCNEGLSTVGSREVFSRVIADQSGAPSMTGSLLAHELFHAFGGATGDGSDAGYHSLNTLADGTSPNRAYNLATRSFLGTANRSVMRLSDSWNNNTTVFEQSAYGTALCTLTPGATGCAAPGSVGTAAAGPAISVSGTYDGTTLDVHTLFNSQIQRGGTDDDSPLRLVQLAGTTELSDTGLLLGEAEPDEITQGNATPPSAWSVNAAVDALPDADRFVIRNESGVLYERPIGTPPSLVFGTGGLTLTGETNLTNRAGDQADPALSPNGALVAYVDGNVIRVQRTDGSGATSTQNITGSAPSWGFDNAHLIYVQNGNVVQSTVTNTGTAPVISSPQTIYAPVLGSPATSVTYSPEGRRVAFTGGGIYVIQLGGGVFSPSTGINCALAIQCVRITTNSTDSHVHWSNANRIGFTRTTSSVTNVHSVAPNGTGLATEVSGASRPFYGGDRLAVARNGGGITLKASDGTLTELTSGSSDTSPTLTGDGLTLAWDRSVGGQRDVFTAGIGTTSPGYQMTGSNPENFRLDLFVDCPAGTEPVIVGLEPSRIEGDTAYFDLVPPSDVCDGGTLQVRGTNGYETAQVAGETVTPGDHPPTSSIVAPASGDTVLQGEPYAPRGLGTDVEDDVIPDERQSWYLSGPGISGERFLGNGAQLADQPGLETPGEYTLRHEVTDSAGQTSSTSITFTVIGDSDHDGIPDATETLPCGPGDPSLDADGDGIYNGDDPAPCSSANNATIDFDPNSLNVNSTGQPVTTKVSTTAGDLRTIDRNTVFITRIGTHAVSIKADSWSASAANSATAQFPRQTVNQFLRDNGLTSGYVPFVIEGRTANGSFAYRGVDPTSPRAST